MGIPIWKILRLVVNTASEPAANLLKLMIRNQKLMYNFFVRIGNRANLFEAKLNFKTAHPHWKIKEELLEIPEISHEEAFMKGVDYFMEVILFYGFVGLWMLYEIRKAIRNSKDQ